MIIPGGNPEGKAQEPENMRAEACEEDRSRQRDEETQRINARQSPVQWD